MAVAEASGNELDDFIAEQMQDPTFVAAFADAGDRSRLVLALIAARKASGFSPDEVAQRMRVLAEIRKGR